MWSYLWFVVGMRLNNFKRKEKINSRVYFSSESKDIVRNRCVRKNISLVLSIYLFFKGI